MKKNDFVLDSIQLQRFVDVLKMLKRLGHIKSLRQIVLENGRTATYLADCLKKNVPISPQFVKSVAVKYPMINMEYVYEGVGEPVNEPITEEKEPLPTTGEPMPELRHYPQEVEMLAMKETIRRLTEAGERQREEMQRMREEVAVLKYRMEQMEKGMA